mgnify:CR=1 FL=1
MSVTTARVLALRCAASPQLQLCQECRGGSRNTSPSLNTSGYGKHEHTIAIQR